MSRFVFPDDITAPHCCKPRRVSPVLGFLEFASRAGAWLTRHHAMRKAESYLQSCDDRMLKDIGLHRSEIGSILRDPAMLARPRGSAEGECGP